jgi:hypothetical protein
MSCIDIFADREAAQGFISKRIQLEYKVDVLEAALCASMKVLGKGRWAVGGQVGPPHSPLGHAPPGAIGPAFRWAWSGGRRAVRFGRFGPLNL